MMIVGCMPRYLATRGRGAKMASITDQGTVSCCGSRIEKSPAADEYRRGICAKLKSDSFSSALKNLLEQADSLKLAQLRDLRLSLR